MQFNDLPIADGTKDAVAAMGYFDATPIQRDAIPHLLKGRDLIGRAQTGTGKTAAFGVPLIDKLRDVRGDGIRGLVLCPTRELALQVTEVLTAVAAGSRVRVVPVYGGAGFDKQEKGLAQRAPLVVVACPGRLLDLMGRGVADIATTEFFILDEADRMLDMGFIHDIKRIEKELPHHRQTALFSATFDGPIRRLAHDFLQDPVTVEVEDTITTDLVDDYHIKVEKSLKKQLLLTLMAREEPSKAIIFTKMKHQAKRLAGDLNKHGWAAVALQGNMTQGQRERAMDAFRDGRARVMVATDVAARGLDVPDISHVINYDLPTEVENYVHRVGRTGRNGQTGRAHSFVQSDEHAHFRDIKRLAGNIPGDPVEPESNAARGPDAPLILVAPQQQRQPSGSTARRSRRRAGKAGQGGGGQQGSHGGRQQGVSSGNRQGRGGRRGRGGRGGGYRSTG